MNLSRLCRDCVAIVKRPAPRLCYNERVNEEQCEAMNFFKALLNPDQEELENKAKVVIAAAANLLQVGEFQFLQLAYRDWYDREIPASQIDRLFASYMMQGRIPHWARHYARKILSQGERGEVDDNDPAYHRYDSDYHTSVPNGVVRFCCSVAAVIFFIGGGIIAAELTAGTSATMFPPYLDVKDLQR